jgi:hypothetical protein
VRRALARAVLDRVVDEPLSPAALAEVREAVSRFAEAARGRLARGSSRSTSACRPRLLSGAGPVLRLFTNAVGDVLAQLPSSPPRSTSSPRGTWPATRRCSPSCAAVRGGVELLLGVLAGATPPRSRASAAAPASGPAPRPSKPRAPAHPASKGRPS